MLAVVMTPNHVPGKRGPGAALAVMSSREAFAEFMGLVMPHGDDARVVLVVKRAR